MSRPISRLRKFHLKIINLCPYMANITLKTKTIAFQRQDLIINCRKTALQFSSIHSCRTNRAPAMADLPNRISRQNLNGRYGCHFKMVSSCRVWCQSPVELVSDNGRLLYMNSNENVNH